MATRIERLSTFLNHPCNRSDISSTTFIFFFQRTSSLLEHYKHTEFNLKNLKKSQFILSWKCHIRYYVLNFLT